MNNYLLIEDFDFGLEAIRSVSAVLITPEEITEVPYGLSAVLVVPSDTDEGYLLSLYKSYYNGGAQGIVELTGDWELDFENQCVGYVP